MPQASVMQLQEIGILASGLATTEVTYVDCSHVGYWARLEDVTSGQIGREEDMMNEIRESLTASARRTLVESQQRFIRASRSIPDWGPGGGWFWARGAICKLDARPWPRACRGGRIGASFRWEWSSIVLVDPIETMERERLCAWPGPEGGWRSLVLLDGAGLCTEPDRLWVRLDGTLSDRADR